MNIISTTKVIEPFHISSVENGFEHQELFTLRTVQSVEMFIKRSKPRMEAFFEDNVLEASFENFYCPIENHYTLNGDGLLSICMRVLDNDKGKHKIYIYDHTTNKLRFLGNIPRHAFVVDIDQSVFDHDDSVFVEGVIGALTQDSKYVVVLAYSTDLLTVNVFDVVNTSCLLEINCSDIEFLRCRPLGIALNPQGIPQGRFQVAIQNDDMEIRLWEGATLSEYAAKLEDVDSCVEYQRGIINARDSTLKFSPDGRLLCVLAYFPDESTCKCVILDAETLEPFCLMNYGFACSDMYRVFPCFTFCSSKFAILSIEHDRDFYDLEKYKYLYFEIPPRMDSLKQLCKFTILKNVHISMLKTLPLPADLLTFLGVKNALSKSLAFQKKRCVLM